MTEQNECRDMGHVLFRLTPLLAVAWRIALNTEWFTRLLLLAALGAILVSGSFVSEFIQDPRPAGRRFTIYFLFIYTATNGHAQKEYFILFYLAQCETDSNAFIVIRNTHRCTHFGWHTFLVAAFSFYHWFISFILSQTMRRQCVSSLYHSHTNFSNQNGWGMCCVPFILRLFPDTLTRTHTHTHISLTARHRISKLRSDTNWQQRKVDTDVNAIFELHEKWYT